MNATPKPPPAPADIKQSEIALLAENNTLRQSLAIAIAALERPWPSTTPEGACVGCGAWTPARHPEAHDHEPNCTEMARIRAICMPDLDKLRAALNTRMVDESMTPSDGVNYLPEDMRIAKQLMIRHLDAERFPLILRHLITGQRLAADDASSQEAADMVVTLRYMANEAQHLLYCLGIAKKFGVPIE